jgi:transcriptional regulator with XRE-family HTH domain
MRRKAQERLAELVREYMRKTGKSQKEVARDACVTLSVLKNAITEGHNASDEKMRQIAEAVGADWDALMAEAAGEAKAEMRVKDAEIVAKINEPAVRGQKLEEQVALLEKNARAMAAERDDMEQRWLQAEQEKDAAAKEAQRAREECDEAVRQMCQVMKERDDATAALERANEAVQRNKARADAMELDLLRLKAGLYDRMMAERE